MLVSLVTAKVITYQAFNICTKDVNIHHFMIPVLTSVIAFVSISAL